MKNENNEITGLLYSLPYLKQSMDEISIEIPLHTLYVIGNGFDLMHGVLSSYYRFRDFLGKHSELREHLERWNLKEDLWADFEDGLACMDEEGMLGTLPEIMTAMGVPEEDDDNFSAADFFAAAEWSVYPLQVIQNELPKQFRRWINGLHSTSSVKPLASLICKEGRYINFNYTEFVETIYGVKKKNILYIHGDRRNKTQELILGHVYGAEDNPAKDRKRRSASIFNQTSYDLYETASKHVVDYYDATTKKSDEIIKKYEDYFEGFADIENIIVIGHSLSYVDYPYFREIIRKVKRVTWNISWHSASDLKRIEKFVDELGIKKEQVILFRA